MEKNDYIFNKNGKSIGKSQAEKNFKQALLNSGINTKERKLVPHSLRYTYVTMLRYKFKPEIVQRFVGHSSIEMTEYYTKANMEDSIEAMIPLLPEINDILKR